MVVWALEIDPFTALLKMTGCAMRTPRFAGDSVPPVESWSTLAVTCVLLPTVTGLGFGLCDSVIHGLALAVPATRSQELVLVPLPLMSTRKPVGFGLDPKLVTRKSSVL